MFRMNRSQRILSMVKSIPKADEEISRMLDFPKYESTKGLEATYVDKLLKGKQFSCLKKLSYG